ncbi:MAG: polysaccharide biosynthesis/export family protein [Planctomycetota bacterium]|nr:polysaccharide biosynthesis/export family protein [Planctomycetaceae bacterium]MDQ3329511.1 polysaccharide biosynthesis/export family protein [Planctomycetota bacterium]
MLSPSKQFLMLALSCAVAGAAGCASTAATSSVARLNVTPVPRELEKVSLPVYRVEPPDILLIESVNNIRPEGAPLRAGDTLEVMLGNPEPLTPVDPQANPIESQYQTDLEVRFKHVSGPYLIQPDGTLNLGPIYGAVQVAGLTPEQAEQAIAEHLKRYTADEAGNPVGLKDPLVSVTLPDISGLQQVAGEHLVRLDGTISLGVYGSVYVAGMTLEEVKYHVESHLSAHLQSPEVSVDVLSYNSKKVYVVTDGGGYGERVVTLPVTGNETVLDAISQIQGLSEVSSKKIWVARPAPSGAECAQVLDVHWEEITREGITTTNYQLLPGDRIFIEADHLMATNNFLAKLIAPVERVFGVGLLGLGLSQRIEFYEQQGARGGVGGGGGF